MSNFFVFVESTYGEVKSIYRKKSIDNTTYRVYLTLKNVFRVLSQEELSKTSYEIIVSEDEIDCFGDITKGTFLTVKSAQGKVIDILIGKHLPQENTVEVIYVKRKTRIRRSK